jgi:hypothetical protein
MNAGGLKFDLGRCCFRLTFLTQEAADRGNQFFAGFRFKNEAADAESPKIVLIKMTTTQKRLDPSIRRDGTRYGPARHYAYASPTGSPHLQTGWESFPDRRRGA